MIARLENYILSNRHIFGWAVLAAGPVCFVSLLYMMASLYTAAPWWVSAPVTAAHLLVYLGISIRLAEPE